MALRPTYWEWRAELEAACARWRLAAFALGGGCLILVLALVWTATRPTPVYFLAADGATLVAGLGRADRVPRETVEAFAAQLALLAGNLTPATARESYQRLQAFMTPALQAALALQIDADLKSLEERRLGTSFAVKQSRVVQQQASRWTVRVAGHRTAWAGPQRLADEPLVYEFELVRGRVSADNPAGLFIDRFQSGRPTEGDLS